MPNALSVRQPWAWAIIHGGKDIENRSTYAIRLGSMNKVIGKQILIHASKGMTRSEYQNAALFMNRIGVECPPPHLLTRGAVIGSVVVSEIVSEHPSPWFFGARGLVLKDPVALSPMAGPGALGIFTWRSIGEVETPKPWMLKHSPTGQRSRLSDFS